MLLMFKKDENFIFDWEKLGLINYVLVNLAIYYHILTDFKFELCSNPQTKDNSCISVSFFLSYPLMWKCKDCGDSFLRRNEVLKHIRLHHRYGRGHAYPCIFEHCPCKCKTWRALIAHLSKFHPAEQSQRGHFSTFKCHLCNNHQLASETEYFQHIGKHLRNHELVSCMFNGCSSQTNLYGAFYTHRWRKHTPYTIRDFKPEAIHGS